VGIGKREHKNVRQNLPWDQAEGVDELLMGVDQSVDLCMLNGQLIEDQLSI
jgi:hypothetical protein